MSSIFIVVAGVSGGLAVAMGAGAAHGLETVLDARGLAWVETAARYQMIHAVAVLALVCAPDRGAPRWHAWAARLMLAGSVIFPGALYGLAFSGIGWLAHLAPFGGLALIAGWLAVAGWAVAGHRQGVSRP